MLGKTKKSLVFSLLIFTLLFSVVKAVDPYVFPHFASFEDGTDSQLTSGTGEVSTNAACLGNYGYLADHDADIATHEIEGVINITETNNASATFYFKVQNISFYTGWRFRRVSAAAIGTILGIHLAVDTGEIHIAYIDDSEGGDTGSNSTGVNATENTIYKVKLVTFMDETDGYHEVYINDEFFWGIYDIDSMTGGANLIDQFYFQSVSPYQALEVHTDQILLTYIEPDFEANFWFIIIGLITCCAIAFYALIITRGRK